MAVVKKYGAKEESVQSAITKIDNLSSQVESQGSTTDGKVDTANTSLATLSNNIGSTNNTGGSSTAGTVFGKLNKIINDIATHVANWTSTRAGYIDTIKSNTDTNNTENSTGTLSQKLTAIYNIVSGRIGITNDTGGTTTAGTLMAKLNALLTNMTSTRAGYIDRIANSTYGLDKIQALVATSSTASSTGTLSQKLTYIISTLIGATGATGGSTTAGTVMAKLNAIITKGNSPSVVKSIQKGRLSQNYQSSAAGTITNYITVSGNYKVFYVDITINSVTASKAIVLTANSDYDLVSGAVAAELTSSTNLRLYVDAGSTSNTYTSAVIYALTWTVIEFY